MESISDHLKDIGNMAKGVTAFEAERARAAFSEISRIAEDIPDLFRAQESDPLSEARPTIWMMFEDFTAKSTGLHLVAKRYSTSINSEADLGPALAAVGAVCSSCHEIYRQ